MAPTPSPPGDTPAGPETPAPAPAPAPASKSAAQEFYERMRQFTDDLLSPGAVPPELPEPSGTSHVSAASQPDAEETRADSGAEPLSPPHSVDDSDTVPVRVPAPEPEPAPAPQPEPEPEPEPEPAPQPEPAPAPQPEPAVTEPVAPSSGRKSRAFPGWARIALIGTVVAPLALAGLAFGTPSHPTPLTVDIVLRLANVMGQGEPTVPDGQPAAPSESEPEQRPDTNAPGAATPPPAGYTYESPDGYSVTFPGKPEITEIPDPLGGNDTVTLATYQSSDVFYQASFSGNPAARLTASDSARGSAAGIGADIVSSTPINLPGADAVASEVTFGGEPTWLLNAVVASPDGVFVLIQGGTASRDDAFFDSFTINRQT